jgi:hypothetical protein
LGFVPNDTTDLSLKVAYVDNAGRYISGSESFAVGSVNGSLTSVVNNNENTFDSVGSGTKTLGVLNSGLAYLDGISNGSEATVSGATLNLFAMAKNTSSGGTDYCKAVWERISWYHNDEHFFIDFNEGSGSTVKDNFGNEYAIQGTVSDGQWINYEKARRVIIDTDMETDCDDAGALRIAAWAERMGYIDIVAMNMSNKTAGLSLAAGVDAIMTFEGRPNLALGVNQSSLVVAGGSPFNSEIIQYPHTVYDDDDLVEDSVSVYRRAVQSAIDDGVKIDIITIGTLRALAAFMKSLPSDGYASGLDMIEQGVNQVFSMGGDYPSGAEFNFNANPQTGLATQYVLSTLENKITFIGAAVGNEVRTGGNLKDIYPELGVDIIRDAYYYHGSADGRRSWDPMTMYLATINNPSQVGQSLTQGSNSASSTGANTFTESNTGTDFYATNIKDSSYYVAPINSILAKQNWPTRDDIGKYSIPRISTLMTLTDGELTQGGNNAGDVVSSFTVSDNEVSTVTVDFTSGTNSNGYYAISGTDVLLTQAGADYLAIGGNQMPDISLTSNTGKTVYNRVETIGTGEWARYYTTFNGNSYMSFNTPVFLNREWSIKIVVSNAVSGDEFLAGSPTSSTNGIFIDYDGSNIRAFGFKGSSLMSILSIPSNGESDFNISLSCDIFGNITFTVNGEEVTGSWPLNGEQYIATVGRRESSYSANGFRVDLIDVTGITNIDAYPTGKVEYQFTENGAENGYKYYPYREDSGDNYLQGVNFVAADVTQTL